MRECFQMYIIKALWLTQCLVPLFYWHKKGFWQCFPFSMVEKFNLHEEFGLLFKQGVKNDFIFFQTFINHLLALQFSYPILN